MEKENLRHLLEAARSVAAANQAQTFVTVAQVSVSFLKIPRMQIQNYILEPSWKLSDLQPSLDKLSGISIKWNGNKLTISLFEKTVEDGSK